MKETLWQIIRFGLVGVLSNSILYGIYLLITAGGAGYKMAMSILYVVGVVQTFCFNRGFTFAHKGRAEGAFFRYCVTYVVGYLFNLTALIVLVDWLDFPHQVVQGGMILLVAILVFGLQKMWVFRSESSSASRMVL